jgi:chromosome segregation ATPase|tara:strand:- start:839 stop:1201 length:363 start_codon:yes stop_codon:yes gene_type:complete
MDPDQRESLRGQIMDLNEKVDQWAQQNTELKDEVDLLKREVTRSHSIIDEKQEEIGKLIADLQTMAEEADEIERLKSDNEFLDRQLTHCWKYAGAQRTVIEYQYSIMDSSIQYKKLTEDV